MKVQPKNLLIALCLTGWAISLVCIFINWTAKSAAVAESKWIEAGMYVGVGITFWAILAVLVVIILSKLSAGLSKRKPPK